MWGRIRGIQPAQTVGWKLNYILDETVLREQSKDKLKEISRENILNLFAI
jgi:hypothetical protein